MHRGVAFEKMDVCVTASIAPRFFSDRHAAGVKCAQPSCRRGGDAPPAFRQRHRLPIVYEALAAAEPTAFQRLLLGAVRASQFGVIGLLPRVLQHFSGNAAALRELRERGLIGERELESLQRPSGSGHGVTDEERVRALRACSGPGRGRGRGAGRSGHRHRHRRGGGKPVGAGERDAGCVRGAGDAAVPGCPSGAGAVRVHGRGERAEAPSRAVVARFGVPLEGAEG